MTRPEIIGDWNFFPVLRADLGTAKTPRRKVLAVIETGRQDRRPVATLAQKLP
jgi:hypothetical protein